jgi:hypothetical protein
MSKIETTTTNLSKREKQLESESVQQRACRLVMQLMRSSFMFAFLCLYPICITYVIIPTYGHSQFVILSAVGSYLLTILCLQAFGSYRALKSFQERRKQRLADLSKLDDQTSISTVFHERTFKWNIGTLLAICLLLFEISQLALFAIHTTATTNDENDDSNNSDSKNNNTNNNWFVRVSYFSFDMLQSNYLEVYSIFCMIFVGLLLLFFVARFVYELRTYSQLKYALRQTEEAKQFYFHSFVGTIIYGHGTLKNVNKLSSKLVGLLSDTLFLVICEKLILVLCCDHQTNTLLIESSVECWTGKHQFYATINLILFGYYVPICSMIAPMFAEPEPEQEKEKDTDNKEEASEDSEDEEKEKSACKKFLSFDNSIKFLKPFLSAITVSKCFMLISANFVSQGHPIGTVISQAIAMLALIVFTLQWSMNNLAQFGLTQNEPGFPFGVSMLRLLGFLAGLIGCLIQLLIYFDFLQLHQQLLILFAVILVIAVLLLFLSRYKRRLFLQLLQQQRQQQKHVQFVAKDDESEANLNKEIETAINKKKLQFSTDSTDIAVSILYFDETLQKFVITQVQ